MRLQGGHRLGWCWVTRRNPRNSRRTYLTWKVELEKQIACVETNETKMKERADQEAHQQNLWDHILRSTAAPVAVTPLASEAATAEALATISTSPPAILSTVTVMTAIDDGDGDWIVASKEGVAWMSSSRTSRGYRARRPWGQIVWKQERNKEKPNRVAH